MGSKNEPHLLLNPYDDPFIEEENKRIEITGNAKARSARKRAKNQKKKIWKGNRRAKRKRSRR